MNNHKEVLGDISERVQWCSTFFGFSIGDLSGQPYWIELLDAHIRHIHELNDPNKIRAYINEMTKYTHWMRVPGYYVEVLNNAAAVRNSENERILTPVRKPDGYWVVRVRNMENGHGETIGIHRLVALASVYNPDPKNKTQVNHIDGFKGNNLAWNLEWVTPSENARHAFRTGLNKGHPGVLNGKNKYSEQQIHQVCQLLQNRPDLPFNKIAEITGVSRGTVSGIYERRRWPELSSSYVFGDRKTVTVYNESQIERVCQLLQDMPDLTYEEIAKLAGVEPKIVGPIARHSTWTSISKEYNIRPKNNSKHNNTKGGI